MSVKLANFGAFIVEDQVFDDGATEVRRYLIEGAINDGTRLPRIIVPVKEFAGAAWVDKHWGARAIVHTGAGTTMLCEAIKTLSGNVPMRQIYGHIGWRLINEEWVYLHAGGGIGAKGPVDNVTVELPRELAFYQLSPPPPDLRAAVTAALKLLDLNVPLAAAAWRAPLIEFCPVDFGLFDAGATGTLKSALTGVAQAFWGPGWNGTHLPGNWSGTANSLEKMAFLIKDAIFTIDDFAPHGGRREVDAMHEKAERIYRAQGNLAGRSRLGSDTTLRQTYYPRSMIVSSGEDVPRGHSLRARMVIDQIGPDDVDAAKLRILQDAAAVGLLAGAMAGFVQRIADRANVRDLAKELKEKQQRLGRKFTGIHRRTPDAVASLMLGIDEFLDFATDAGAIGDLEAERLSTAAEQTLCSVAAAQVSEQAQEDPINMFAEAIPSVLASCRAHLANKDGTEPADASSLGWRRTSREVSGAIRYDSSPQGDRMGWIAGEQIWLLPTESIAVIEGTLREQGSSLAIGRSTLGKRLREKGWLIELGKNDNPTKPVNIGGHTVRVFVFAKARLFPSSE
jgi:hypothetical protein